MFDVKTWTQSKTVWAAIVAAIAQVLQLLKFTVSPELLQSISDWLLSLITLVSAGVALWGRLRATKQIVRKDDLPSPAWLLAAAMLGAVLALGGGGCGAIVPPSEAYVAADRATFDAVALEYSAYVAADPLLGPEQKARRGRTVETWRMRVEGHERPATTANGSPTP